MGLIKSLRSISHGKYVCILGVIFIIEAVLLAFNPHDRADWMLENALVVVFLITVSITYKHLPLSRISYTLVFVFLILHEIGAHYTYAQVPYDAWFEAVFGRTFNSLLGWERNHFDRVIHFSYGLLLAYPIREVFLRVADVKGFWGYFLPIDITMSTSMLFELFEWAAAVFFGGELGMAYLGTQGDVWDAHKDMGLATCGAVIAMLVTALINIKLQRDFSREWVDSLKVKHKKPLGEDEIARMTGEESN